MTDTKDLLDTKPYPNEHSCRLRDPNDFQKESMRRVPRKHNGKVYDIIMGRLTDETTMTEQAYRYPKDKWDAADAKVHCQDHDGKFEAATGKAFCEQEAKEYLGLLEEKRALFDALETPTIPNSKE